MVLFRVIRYDSIRLKARAHDVLSLYSQIVKAWRVIKGLQLSGLATENHYRDSFEGSKAGLFASNIANKADTCAETSKKKMCHTLYECTWLETTWTVWLVHFVDRVAVYKMLKKDNFFYSC